MIQSINQNKSIKFRNSIGKMFRARKSGTGMYKSVHNQIDYVNWDDQNELVDRLHLLMAKLNETRQFEHLLQDKQDRLR